MKKYISPSGAYVPGLPARDLTDEEWERATPDQKARAAGLYEHVPDEDNNNEQEHTNASESQPAS